MGLLLCSLYTMAQQVTAPVEMADGLRASGKIYVVVLGVALVFAGLVAYAARIDRRLTRLEKEVKEERKNLHERQNKTTSSTFS
jgi:CcmD family protein